MNSAKECLFYTRHFFVLFFYDDRVKSDKAKRIKSSDRIVKSSTIIK